MDGNVGLRLGFSLGLASAVKSGRGCLPMHSGVLLANPSVSHQPRGQTLAQMAAGHEGRYSRDQVTQIPSGVTQESVE